MADCHEYWRGRMLWREARNLASSRKPWSWTGAVMVDSCEQGEGKRSASGWNFQHLWLAFVAAVFLQSLILPCLCAEGDAKGKVALAFDLLVLARMGFAWITNETGRGWLFYVILLYTSAFWIEGAACVLFR